MPSARRDGSTPYTRFARGYSLTWTIAVANTMPPEPGAHHTWLLGLDTHIPSRVTFARLVCVLGVSPRTDGIGAALRQEVVDA